MIAARGGRQVLDGFGQKDEDNEDEASRDEPADLAGDAHAEVHPGARAGRAHRHSLSHARGSVSCAEREQLLVRVDLFTALGRE
jgi:hypothetical protein